VATANRARLVLGTVRLGSLRLVRECLVIGFDVIKWPEPSAADVAWSEPSQ
jgi:hypothetical protein